MKNPPLKKYTRDGKPVPVIDTVTGHLPKEQWKDIPDFEGLYQISDYGRVWSESRWVYSKNRPDAFRPGRFIKLRLLHGSRNKKKSDGDIDVMMKLHKDGTRYQLSVARYVYYLFVADFDLQDHSLIIRRKNRDKLDCRFTNLELSSVSDVAKQGYAAKTRKSIFQEQSKPVSQYSLEGKFISTFACAKKAAETTGIPSEQINDGARRKVRQVKGFYWRYGKPSKQIRVSALKQRRTHARRVQKRKVQQLSLTGKRLKTYDSVLAAAKAVGLSSGTTISHACVGKLYTSKGYRWQYA